MSRALRDSFSKANLYIIRRRLYRTADAAFRGAKPALADRFNYSYASAMQSIDTGNFQPSTVVNLRMWTRSLFSTGPGKRFEREFIKFKGNSWILEAIITTLRRLGKGINLRKF
jgi:hypothetical protein